LTIDRGFSLDSDFQSQKGHSTESSILIDVEEFEGDGLFILMDIAYLILWSGARKFDWLLSTCSETLF